MLSFQYAFTFLFLVAVSAEAKLELYKAQRLQMPVEIVSPQEQQVVQFSNRLSNNITSEDSSQIAVSKMLDNSLSYFWDTSGVKNTGLGKAMQKVEKNMKADVNLGSTTSALSGKQVQHKFSFKVLAAQAFAKLEYLGWFKLGLKYDARSKATITEVTENLDNNKDLVISHVNAKEENKSQISLRWDW